jgi:hypothetical protein
VDNSILFTTSVLCLKPDSLFNEIQQKWANNCVKSFIKPLIDIIKPEIVITMSKIAYGGIRHAFELESAIQLSEAIKKQDGIKLYKNCVLFPMFHYGGKGSSIRKFEDQLNDWEKIKAYKFKKGL